MFQKHITGEKWSFILLGRLSVGFSFFLFTICLIGFLSLEFLQLEYTWTCFNWVSSFFCFQSYYRTALHPFYTQYLRQSHLMQEVFHLLTNSAPLESSHRPHRVYFFCISSRKVMTSNRISVSLRFLKRVYLKMILGVSVRTAILLGQEKRTGFSTEFYSKWNLVPAYLERFLRLKLCKFVCILKKLLLSTSLLWRQLWSGGSSFTRFRNGAVLQLFSEVRCSCSCYLMIETEKR